MCQGSHNVFRRRHEHISQREQSGPDILKDVDVWMKSKKLKCNLDKSKVVFFGGKTANVELGDFGLSVHPNLKYLGIIIDEKLLSKTT